MTLEEVKKIDFFKNADSVSPVLGGYTDSQTYMVQCDGIKFFLKIRVKPVNLKYNFNLFKKQNITVPKVYNFGRFGKKQYFITEFIDGLMLKPAYNLISEKEIFNIGFNIGKEQRLLAKKVKLKVDKQKFLTQFTQKFSDNYKRAKNMLEEKRQFIGESFNYLNKLIAKSSNIKNQIEKLFKDEELFYAHQDIKAGNFLFKDGKVWTIDYEETTFGYFAWKIRSDFFELMKYETYEKTWLFLNGVICGFYDNKIPAILSRQLKLIFYYSICRHIVKCFDKNDYESIKKIQANLENNIKKFKKLDNAFQFREYKKITLK